MSIYPVKLSQWFPPGDSLHSLVKFIVSNGYGDVATGCLHCGKKCMHWQQAIAHHSLPYGYGDIWCREKCYKNYLNKRKKVKND